MGRKKPYAFSKRSSYSRHGALHQFTSDQTMGDDLVDIGAVTEQQAQNAGLYDVLSSEVGGYLVPSVGVVDLAAGDTIFLCTDSLTKHVTDDRIAALLSAGDAKSAAQSLIDAALEGGGRDNVTVVVARATGASHSSSYILPLLFSAAPTRPGGTFSRRPSTDWASAPRFTTTPS